MKYKSKNIGRLFYFDPDIPSDVTYVKLQARGVKADAVKLFWRFYWLT